MHSSTVSTPSTTAEATGRSASIAQYHYSSIPTLRRPGRPSNINLSSFDHENPQLAQDPEIYSAPICFINQSDAHHHHHHHHHNNHHHHHHRAHMQLTSQPYTASIQYQAPPLPDQHLRVPPQTHHHMQLGPPLTLPPLQPPPQQQQQQQQQQQTLMDQYVQHQHTPHTFPLRGSPNHYRQCFEFPPSTLPIGVASNNLHPTHMQDQQQQQQQSQSWTNTVLGSMLVPQMNASTANMAMVDEDDDEDPSASMNAIDALVADVDSSPHDLLDDQHEKSLPTSKTSSTLPPGSITTSPHVYLRSKSHILTTPPNPLAADDHPDNQLNVGQNFQKTFSPIHSAGFELTANNNNNNNNTTMKLSSSTSSNPTVGRSIFNFETTLAESNDLEQEKLTKPLLHNSDLRTGNHFMHDDSSNQSSTNSSTHPTPGQMFTQMLRSSEQQGLSTSPSPRSNDTRRSPLDLANHPSNGNSASNRHLCTHPDCNKIFANKSALAKHKLTHSQDRKHKCPKCNKGFKRLDHLNGHMLTHEEEKPHKCLVPNCNRTYCDGRSLKRHIENVHQDVLAAIYENRESKYRACLPETAVVKTRELSLNTDFSIDSVDSNSPHSSNDNEQSLHLRTATGQKSMITYTYDEEKFVECQICKKPFKNGAALNGHMRLHGGFNERQTPPSTMETPEKKKRQQGAKRKRTDSVRIKTEQRDIPMVSPINDRYSPSPSSNVLPRAFQEAALSSFVPNPLLMQSHQNVPSAKHPRMASTNPMTNSLIFSRNEQYDDVFPKSISPQISHPNRTVNGTPRQFVRVPPVPPPQAHFSIGPIGSGSIPANIFHPAHFSNPVRHPHSIPQQLEEPIRYTSSSIFHTSPQTKPEQNYSRGSPAANSTSSINTSATSPYHNFYADHSSPKPSLPLSDTNGIQSSHCPSGIPLYTGRKKEFIRSLQHQTPDEKPMSDIEEPPSPPRGVLEIIPDIDSPVKKNMSGFLIGTPSSNGGSSSSSSTSSQKHFNYDELPVQKPRESTQSSFQWPSQFRRQLSLTIPNQISNPLPSTPYTPPPMLSPFRKGPGLYYRAFSHLGLSHETSSIPTTPIPDESASPKINIGRDYQAIIPRLRTDLNEYTDDSGDELLFSPLDTHSFDEKSLEKFEQLNRMNPYLFSPRHSPVIYPLELIYMLLYEYHGDLQRTIAVLLEGKVNDIKQCRPIHHYRFPECEQWTEVEINAFTKAMQNSEKNFTVVSRKVGTKSVKQCIEFHYMPKVNLTSRKISPKATSSVITRRKRIQMINDETSSSPINDSRLGDDDNSMIHGEGSPVTQFICDVDKCCQTFTSDRACRAHRKEHRRLVHRSTNVKRSRALEMQK